MVRLVAAFAVLVLGACSDEPNAPNIDLTQLGAACGAGDTCQQGVTCVTYTGLGGQLKSCEISCADDADACPAGASCVTITDGPGEVCRAD
jgi:hypothetical protein